LAGQNLFFMSQCAMKLKEDFAMRGDEKSNNFKVVTIKRFKR